MTYIYAIQHNVTKKIYIGKTKDVYKRFYQHICKLKIGKHPSQEMLRDFQKYGNDFSVFILDAIENGKQRIRVNGRELTLERMKEVEYMQKYNTLEKGYNVQDSVSKKMIGTGSEPFPFKDGVPEME